MEVIRFSHRLKESLAKLDLPTQEDVAKKVGEFDLDAPDEIAAWYCEFLESKHINIVFEHFLHLITISYDHQDTKIQQRARHIFNAAVVSTFYRQVAETAFPGGRLLPALDLRSAIARNLLWKIARSSRWATRALLDPAFGVVESTLGTACEEIERRRDPKYHDRERDKMFVVTDEGFAHLIRNLKLMLVADAGDGYPRALEKSNLRLNRTILIAQDNGSTVVPQDHIDPEVQKQWSSYLALELGKEVEVGAKFAAMSTWPNKPPAAVLRSFRGARRSFQENELGACCWNTRCKAAEAGKVVWKKGKLIYCGGCKAARYCNAKCRSEHAEIHKKACDSIPQLKGSDTLEAQDKGPVDFSEELWVLFVLALVVIGAVVVNFVIS
ncbi:hypothetical protein M427DRAFT_33273 [Gonapodya prolifera JEL478]|uniref:MYND-type domain-containing protein n=1 Tax=Gonapodya prolifera (strain JEL478) TaxID=1344416 RepID=A0A139AC23_GONPJ|nr:hypothetical protein M427DRAFT_33273 [Gonapodya prolifera JEL478]|eukprot:KXS14351.1 hypothetical protein M427DRAFT_33273 [Gonapodya prolifera JEL478]